MTEKTPLLVSPEKLYSRAYVRDLLVAHDITLNKRRGQNFLIEKNSVAQVLAHAAIPSDACVLEVGAGIGHLTYPLLLAAGHVIAIEIDERFIPVLKGMCAGHPHLTLVLGDIMKIPLAERCREIGKIPTDVVANVPYYITTPIIEKLRKSGLPLRSITVTIQDDVAERYVALPGTSAYSSISVVLRYWGVPTLCARVPHTSFYPRPKVDSAIVRIALHETPPVGVSDEAFMYRIIRLAFHTKRKMIHNALSSLTQEGYDVKEALHAAGMSPSTRPAEWDIDAYARLTDALIATSTFASTRDA